MMVSRVRLNDHSLLADQNFINGGWIESVSGKRYNVSDLATGELIGSCPESTVQDAENAVASAAAAFPAWCSLAGRNRSRILRHWHDLNGKAGPDTAGEVIFASSFLEWFSEEAARIHGDIVPHSAPGFRVAVSREPVGVCGLITPWNVPAAMITRKLGPALAAGCTVVVKTAGETPFTANALTVLSERAGVPKGVINVITALKNTGEIGETLCKSNVIRMISLTGSTRVGKLLMQQSSSTLKKLSLERGGNAPFIVFNDADLDLALQGVITSKFKCSGQTCVCSNRIFVQKDIYQEFIRRLKNAVGNFKVGHGLDSQTTHGPLVTQVAAERVDGLVKDAVKKGAKIEAGGKRHLDLGKSPNFFKPTIVSNLKPDMRIVNEEIFGPVAPIFEFDTEAEVVDAANRCEVGLASYIYTQDVSRATRISELLQFGMVALNTGVMSDAAAPFGEIKHSGIGREGSKYGIDDYLQMKTLVTGNVNVIHRSHL
ncbi:Aldehyde/histidinol dehydrogenase [Xylaria cf. heliscus]|nr:Aldehyde/histidinol dehydrogenase [Xylaria cf. heliscus]